MTATTQIETILILQAGETPSQHSTNPGELSGPWGATAEDAIAAYESDTGFRVLEHWLRDDALWIVSDEERGE